MEELYHDEISVDGRRKNDKTVIFESMPPGFRFVPKDQELVECYLMKKVLNEPYPSNIIHDVDLYTNGPDQLTEQYKASGENVWYFFSQRNKKYPNGKRPARSTPTGYWKPTGTDKGIIKEGCVHPIGTMRTLDFYKGHHPLGIKTQWKMHDYLLAANHSAIINSQIDSIPRDNNTLDNWVLCRIYMNGKKKGSNNGTLSPTVTAPHNNPSQSTAANVSQNDGASSMEGGNITNGFQDQYVTNAFEPIDNVLRYFNDEDVNFEWISSI